jgi:hypothetical protein
MDRFCCLVLITFAGESFVIRQCLI